MTETIQGHLYDFPSYYDLVFGSDWKAEFDFLLACFDTYGRNVRRLFEPACGTGRLLYRLAEAGYDVHGIDLNPAAVEYCNRRMQRRGLAPAATVADMTTYRCRPRVDAAFNMINSFRHLLGSAPPRQHLRCVADSLRRDGLYVLGLHLTPLAVEPMDEESWSARRGHLAVTTHLQTIDRDLRRRVERFRMTYDVYTPTRHFRIEDKVAFRTYTRSQFLRLLKDEGSFEIAALHDFAYRIDEPIELDDATEDVVFVLRKK